MSIYYIEMLKQIFKENISIDVLFELLEKVCLKTDKYYFIDNNAFKKILYFKLQAHLKLW